MKNQHHIEEPPIELFKVRPRFSAETEVSVETLTEDFSQALAKGGRSVDGIVRMGYVALFPLERDIHYWSPYLTLSFEREEGQTIIYGVYGPSPVVWTMFIFFYSVIGLATVILTVIGFANRSIGESAQVLWLVPVLLLAFLSLYLVSYFGQQKGKDQIHSIHQFVEDCIGHEIGRKIN